MYLESLAVSNNFKISARHDGDRGVCLGRAGR
jgi:hypothetical protein